jgi:hypothetical protein
MRRLLRDPLAHFLLGGLLIFLAFAAVRGRDAGSDRADLIVVDRAALLDFVQKRSRAFDPELAARRLEALSDAEFERLVEDYVREEALHREALALALDRDDYVLRRRLVQKLEFVAQGFVEAGTAIDEAELLRFFEAHADDYYAEPSVTFTHVFFDAEVRGRDGARREAEAQLERLNRERVPFTGAPRHGDRFLYHVNYVERTPDYVESHFGREMGRAVFALEPDLGRWHGPFDSPYGSHLVMISGRTPGRTPALEEIRGRVEEDARRALVRERSEAAIAEIVGRYDVRLDLDRAPVAAGPSAPGGGS